MNTLDQCQGSRGSSGGAKNFQNPGPEAPKSRSGGVLGGKCELSHTKRGQVKLSVIKLSQARLEQYKFKFQQRINLVQLSIFSFEFY